MEQNNNTTELSERASWKRTISRSDPGKWSLLYAPSLGEEAATALFLAIGLTCRRGAWLQASRRFVELPEHPDVRLWLIPAALEVGCN